MSGDGPYATERPECKCTGGCGQIVDPTTCCCGDPIEGDGWHDNHSPVPMGCQCHLINQGLRDIAEAQRTPKDPDK